MWVFFFNSNVFGSKFAPQWGNEAPRCIIQSIHSLSTALLCLPGSSCCKHLMSETHFHAVKKLNQRHGGCWSRGKQADGDELEGAGGWDHGGTVQHCDGWHGRVREGGTSQWREGGRDGNGCRAARHGQSTRMMGFVPKFLHKFHFEGPRLCSLQTLILHRL